MGSTGRVTSAVKFGISATVSSVAPTEAFHTTESYGMPLLEQHQSGLDWQSHVSCEVRDLGECQLHHCTVEASSVRPRLCWDDD